MILGLYPASSQAEPTTGRANNVIIVDFPDPTNFSIGKLYNKRLVIVKAPVKAGRLGGEERLKYVSYGQLYHQPNHHYQRQHTK